ncbi:ATP-dependent DNA helicase pfh1-like [Cornus florida]|uniref:ATP-dependent DNA helicase pfh1-like n=1 Tax=Cornus florida TaxID=4283 RepID=UPI00289B9B64|nr:ATP-dependent DNA helicase pfh1-like [Cornus florida]
MGRSVKQFDLPNIVSRDVCNHSFTKEIDDEYAIVTPFEDYNAVATLNAKQKNAYDMIVECVLSNKPGIFFIDGPGGTGKTYLYRAILAKVRSEKKIALATASSGVASSILPGGRTAHSRFKIPILANESAVCNISKQSSIAKLMRKASVIIWDEAPMAKRYAIEAVDRTLQDLLSTTEPFGGKVAVFGGDFRQVLPVVPRGTRAETIGVSLVESYLWKKMKKIQLKQNMRARTDPSFADFLLRVGSGEEPVLVDNMIKLPDEMVIKSTNEEDLEKELINAVFPHLIENAHSAEYITNRAILATKNDFVDKLNENLIEQFPSKPTTYFSFDKATDDTGTYYQEDFLNSLAPNGLPPHKLTLKVDFPIMLLRNLDPTNGCVMVPGSSVVEQRPM